MEVVEEAIKEGEEIGKRKAYRNVKQKLKGII